MEISFSGNLHTAVITKEMMQYLLFTSKGCDFPWNIWRSEMDEISFSWIDIAKFQSFSTALCKKKCIDIFKKMIMFYLLIWKKYIQSTLFVCSKIHVSSSC